MQRRDFLKYLAGGLVLTWGAIVGIPILKYLKKPAEKEAAVTEVLVAVKDELQPGQSKTFKFGKRPGLLIRGEDGVYEAFDSTCTHLGCISQHRPEKRDIYCACHGGVYDLKGGNVSGPPPRPLEKLIAKTTSSGDVMVMKG